jgi:hypothetical protein
MTSALDGVSGQRHAPAALYPMGKDRLYPLNRRLGGRQELAWIQRLDGKYFASPVNRTPVVNNNNKYVYRLRLTCLFCA